MAVSEVPAASQVSGSVVFTVIPSIPGTFTSASQSQPVVGTSTTHQAASATSQVGVSAAPNMIGTIHGPGTPGLIATVEGSVEPVVSASTFCEGESNIVMVVEDDNDDIVEVGMAQGFTKITEPKKEKMDLPHASRGRGVGSGAF